MRPRVLCRVSEGESWHLAAGCGTGCGWGRVEAASSVSRVGLECLGLCPQRTGEGILSFERCRERRRSRSCGWCGQATSDSGLRLSHRRVVKSPPVDSCGENFGRGSFGEDKSRLRMCRAVSTRDPSTQPVSFCGQTGHLHTSYPQSPGFGVYELQWSPANHTHSSDRLNHIKGATGRLRLVATRNRGSEVTNPWTNPGWLKLPKRRPSECLVCNDSGPVTWLEKWQVNG